MHNLEEAIATMRRHETAARAGASFLRELHDAIVIAPDSFHLSGSASPVDNPLDVVVCGLQVWIAAAVTPESGTAIEFGRVSLADDGRILRKRDGVMSMREARQRFQCRAHGEAFLIEVAAEVRRMLHGGGLFDRAQSTVNGIAVPGELRP